MTSRKKRKLVAAIVFLTVGCLCNCSNQKAVSFLDKGGRVLGTNNPSTEWAKAEKVRVDNIEYETPFCRKERIRLELSPLLDPMVQATIVVDSRHKLADWSSMQIDNHKILICGGTLFDDRGNKEVQNTTWVFDTAKNELIKGSTMLERRSSPELTMLANGDILVSGGQSGHAILSSCEIYQKNKRQFRRSCSMVVPRIGHSTLLLRDGHRIVLVGGETNFGRSDADGSLTTTAELMDLEKNVSTIVGSLSIARSGPVLISDQPNTIKVIGGWSVRKKPSESVWTKAVEVISVAPI